MTLVRLDPALIEVIVERTAARASELVLGNLIELQHEERADWTARLDEIAEAVAAKLGVELPREDHLLDAAGVAERYGVTADWVRLNADRLGALRLGDGPRARLRFDAEKVADALTTRQVSRRSAPADSSPRRRSRRRTASGAPLLPIRAPNQRPQTGSEQV